MLLDIRPDHLKIVQDILKKHVPDHEVWAFGSRVKWTARDYSDLDLCVISDQPLGWGVKGDLLDDFAESDLPWKVDVVDWATTSESFRRIIEMEKVVVQKDKARHDQFPSSYILLRKLLIETKDGEWGKDAPFENSIQMAVIRGTDFDAVKIGSLTGVPIRYINKKAAKRKALQPFDILIETAGGSKGKPTGKTVLIKPSLFDKTELEITCASFARFMRIDTTLAKPEFIYIYLKWLYLNGEMENHQIQHTGVARFQFTKFADSVEIPLPEISIQKNISDFFGALDDRITLLRETNATLEAIAQALFKSWFIDFDPVHAKQQGFAPEGMDEATAALFPDSFEESELGLIPKGWRVKSFNQLCNISSGKRPLERNDTVTSIAKIPLYGGAGIMGFTNSSLFDVPKIVTGRVGTLGKIYIAHPPFWASDNALVISPIASKNIYFCYEWIKKIDVSVLNKGSTQPLLTQKDLGNQKNIVPFDSLLDLFFSVISPVYRAIFQNTEHAQTLTTLRDTLLPRLISGQLRLPEVEALPGEASK
ncbi:MAG: restriction endonuclease subunit S [Magnetococcales bacterium]|nr:restriction endonuclease subunit S [Magnetococcales bacterium]